MSKFADLDKLVYRILDNSSETSKQPVEAVRIKNYEELSKLTGNYIPRFEYFRGDEGERILDLSLLRGIEEKDNVIYVYAGTKWEDAIKHNPEIFGNPELSVGGSIWYNETGFGFNEFGRFRNRIRIEKSYDNIPILLSIKKEQKKIVSKEKEGEFTSLLKLALSFYEKGIPPFRDIRLEYRLGKSKLVVSYPEVREPVLINYLYATTFEESSPLFEKIFLEHYFKYFGYTSFENLEYILKLKEKLNYLLLEFRKNEIFFEILSEIPVDLPQATANFTYASKGRGQILQKCILCGKCLDVCPYFEQTNQIIFSPMGYYLLRKYNEESIFTCNLCGRCNEVCPVNLDIVNDIRKSLLSRQKEPTESFTGLFIPAETVLLVTSISLDNIDEIIKCSYYIKKIKNKPLGILILRTAIWNIISGNPQLADFLTKTVQEEKIKSIITITPEEYSYIKRLLKDTVRVEFIQIEILNEIKDKISNIKVHIPCLLNSNEVYVLDKASIENTCSLEFLSRINNYKFSKKDLKSTVTLCPLTANSYNKKTPLSFYMEANNISLSVSIMPIEDLITKLKKVDTENKELLIDAEYYKQIDNNTYQRIIEALYGSFLRSLGIENLTLLLLNYDKLDVKDKDLILNALRTAYLTI